MIRNTFMYPKMMELIWRKFLCFGPFFSSFESLNQLCIYTPLLNFQITRKIGKNDQKYRDFSRPNLLIFIYLQLVPFTSWQEKKIVRGAFEKNGSQVQPGMLENRQLADPRTQEIFYPCFWRFRFRKSRENFGGRIVGRWG